MWSIRKLICLQIGMGKKVVKHNLQYQLVLSKYRFEECLITLNVNNSHMKLENKHTKQWKCKKEWKWVERCLDAWTTISFICLCMALLTDAFCWIWCAIAALKGPLHVLSTGVLQQPFQFIEIWSFMSWVFPTHQHYVIDVRRALRGRRHSVPRGDRIVHLLIWESCKNIHKRDVL